MTSLSTPESPAITLDPWLYQDMRWCVNCGGLQLLIAIFEIESGRLGVCMGCGEEKFLPFTRTIGEAA
ncbi:MAG TPA: hypothetical protein VGG46_03845 [Terriglobales bacterium]|jgi:hypothetical protein